MFTNTSFSSLVHMELVFILGDFCEKRYKLKSGSAKKDTSYKGVLVKKTQSNGGSVRMLVPVEDVFLGVIGFGCFGLNHDGSVTSLVELGLVGNGAHDVTGRECQGTDRYRCKTG